VKCVFLVGAIGAGKSTALKYLKRKGADILSADAIVHQLYEKDPHLIQEIGEAFSGVVDEKSTVNRQALAAHLLSYPERFQVLEKLVHPKVREKLVKALKMSTAKVLVYELPIARDTTDFSIADAVILIEAQSDTRLERLVTRGISKEEALERMRLHPNPFTPGDKPLYCIQNDEGESQLFFQLDAIWKELVDD
jgi:dephospho-CoA kinase